jgi:DnaJ-class molecular chaperone
MQELQGGKPGNSLRRCYRCSGTGSIEDGRELEGNIPSRFGNWGSVKRIHYSTCPLCKGSGHIKTHEIAATDMKVRF